MFKSVISKFVGLSVTTVLTGAMIASSASALNVKPAPLPPACTTPQISMASSGYAVQGTCFRPGDTDVISFSDSYGRSASETEVASANGTFTAPLIYLGYGATETFQAWDFTTITYSNTITIAEPKLN
jgi:hypothetical protein